MKKNPTRESEMLRQARYRLGYSQHQVATMVGIQIRQYQRFEYGETEVCRINMKAGLLLCVVLELDPVKLIFGDNPEMLIRSITQRPVKGNLKKRGGK